MESEGSIMKKMGNILWGIILIALGVIIGLKTLGICDLNIFFKGWWTLFIIVPSFVSIIKDEEKTGSLIAFLIGVALLLSSRDIIDFSLIWKLLLPIIFVIIGLTIIFKDSFKSSIKKELKEVKKDKNSKEITATFSEQKVNYDDETFNGATINAIFGSVKLDLRKAKIKKDALIDTTSIFGGVEILLPKDVNVKVASTSVFGSTDNKIKNEKENEKSKNLYINSTNIFGGTEIK